jgi:phosphate transport system substrate-binding protein
MKTRIRATSGWTTLLPTVLAGTLFFAAPAKVTTAPIAVIVHEQVPVDDLSLAELRRIFRGERLFWEKELTITLLAPPRGSREREVLLDKVYERGGEAEYQRYWINKLFDKRAQTAPKITGSPQMSAGLVREIPGAIALVPANRIPRGVKVLRIDGRSPGEAGYPLVPPG